MDGLCAEQRVGGCLLYACDVTWTKECVWMVCVLNGGWGGGGGLHVVYL